LLFSAFFFLLIADTGYLIAPTKNDNNQASKTFDDDERASINQSTSPAIEFKTNSISEEYLAEANVNKTFFRSLNNSVIVSQVGSIVQIPCRVHLIGDEMVKSLSRLIAPIILSLSSLFPPNSSRPLLHYALRLKGLVDTEKRLPFTYGWADKVQQR
jgi:hypothetical protein